jgi:pimeloyl-ACP methyl ester carboxylesterase
LLTYDRFGQGLTIARDPLDGQAGKADGYDLLDVASDLHEIIIAIAISKLGLMKCDVESGKLHVFLVGVSIGSPILRLYAQEHPGIVAAALLLGSNIANVNYSEVLPDPDGIEFDPNSVISDDCTLQQYREARMKLAAMFDLHVKNLESLDRRSSPFLLPHADRPKLLGPAGNGPLSTVVGHDPVTFAELSQKGMGTPKSLSMRFTNP